MTVGHKSVNNGNFITPLKNIYEKVSFNFISSLKMYYIYVERNNPIS